MGRAVWILTRAKPFQHLPTIIMQDSAKTRVTLREASATDAAALSEIAWNAKRSWGYSDELMRLWKAELTISSELLSARKTATRKTIVRRTIVAEIQGQPVAFAALELTERSAEIDNMWVLPECQRCGIGRALFQRLVQHAASVGHRQVVIVADPHAAEFYARLGAVHRGWEDSIPKGRKLPRFEYEIGL